jgi:glycosyltransferase involved in cell wall biosynthesis
VNQAIPRVSVCVCAFNGARVIGQAIDSILAQTYDDFELLVIDDASTDDTPRIVSRYEDKRLRLLRNLQNLGNAGNRSQAIRLSQAELVKFVDQDDWLQPSCLEHHVRCMEANPTVGLTFSRLAIALQDPGTPHADWWLWWPEEARRVNAALGKRNAGSDVLRRFVNDGIRVNWVGMPTGVMLRKSCLRESRLFSRRLRMQLDLDLWIRVMAYCDVGYLDQQLATVRVGSANESRGIQGNRPDWLDRLWMLEGLMREFPDVWRRYPELATMRRAELKSVIVATVSGRFRAARRSDALRNLTDYAAYTLSRNRQSLYDSL